MKFKIENAKTTFFTDKEHYLNFRAAWKAACNDERRKKTLVRESWGAYKKPGWLTGAHHLLFNALCSKDYSQGFKPKVSKRKLTGGCYINEGIYDALNGINATESFLEPFAGTVTKEMVNAVKQELPEMPLMESFYGKGKKVTTKILGGEKVTSFQDLWKLYEGLE